MRSIVRTSIAEITPPSAAVRDEALKRWGSQAAHDGYMADLSCMTTIEVADPPAQSDPPSAFQVAAWNIERCKRVEETAGAIRKAQADIVLATEMDHGMARSGQRHTTADLADILGFGYAFGVEFIELGTGDVHETAEFSQVPNRHGLHGNAILSRWPLEQVTLIPIDDGGFWYAQAPKDDGQYRIGGRMAIAAQIYTQSGPLLLVSVHLESQSDAQGRAAQVQRLLDQLHVQFGNGPAIVGGDFNTKGFLEAGMTREQIMSDPASVEPCFTLFAEHGFDWRASNTGAPTTRNPPWAKDAAPLKTLDWLFTRDVAARDPAVFPALSETGEYLSDHELVAAGILP